VCKVWQLFNVMDEIVKGGSDNLRTTAERLLLANSTRSLDGRAGPKAALGPHRAHLSG
jgi:hypothetical protein